jgi:hypothetical protein
MSLLAKAIVKNKCWVVEDNGHQVGTILATPRGVVYQHNEQREQFASLKILSDKYNIVVDKTPPKKSSLKATVCMVIRANIKLIISYGMSNIDYLSLPKVLRARVSSVPDIILSNLTTVG